MTRTAHNLAVVSLLLWAVAAGLFLTRLIDAILAGSPPLGDMAWFAVGLFLALFMSTIQIALLWRRKDFKRS